jgi:hypothetical protein
LLQVYRKAECNAVLEMFSDSKASASIEPLPMTSPPRALRVETFLKGWLWLQSTPWCAPRQINPAQGGECNEVDEANRIDTGLALADGNWKWNLYPADLFRDGQPSFVSDWALSPAGLCRTVPRRPDMVGV